MNFQDEQGRIWELPTYVTRQCVECHKPFLIADTDMTTFSCGMQDAIHQPFVYTPSTYRIGGEPEVSA